ncbi:MAG: hypothetical protein ACJZ7Z_12135 [Myxococcota bacterium]
MPRLASILITVALFNVFALACSDDSGVGPYYPYGPGTSFTCAECAGTTAFLPNSSESECRVLAQRFECQFGSYSAGLCPNEPRPSCTVTNCQIDPSSACVP